MLKVFFVTEAPSPPNTYLGAFAFKCCLPVSTLGHISFYNPFPPKGFPIDE